MRFGAWVVEGELGRGGMGVVYAAVHSESGERRALKVIHAPVGADEEVARFSREVRVCMALRHPHVVRVVGVERTGPENGALPTQAEPCCLILELCEGGSLAGPVRRDGPLPARQALELFDGVLAGLGHVHQEHGFVHRDIKPDNILLAFGSDGRTTAKLADFGLGIRQRRTQRADSHRRGPRSGRAFLETEGHVILTAKNRYGAAQLRKRCLDRDKIEPIFSTLTMLYVNLVHARLGRNPAPGEDLSGLDFTDPETSNPALWAAVLDIQLLALLAEEVVDTPDQDLLEHAARDLLAHTLGGHQLGANAFALEPLVRFSARRVAALARQLPDRAARAAIVRTGLSIQGGMEALPAAETIAAMLEADPALLTVDGWPALQHFVITTATSVRELQRAAAQKKILAAAIPTLARDWIAGTSPTELHRRHQLTLGTKDITETSAIVDRVLTQDLAWVVSAIVQLLELAAVKPPSAPCPPSPP